MARHGHPGERGFTLAALLVTLTILALVIAYTVPVTWSDVLRRERDQQTIFAMRQYAIAIAEYQKVKGVAPTSLAQLKEQQKPRILRAEYLDPMTGKLDWILVPATPAGTPVQVVPPAPPDRDDRGGNGSPRTTTSLITDANSSSYTGPFNGVRPPVRGRAFLSLKGIDRYELWAFTTNDLLAEANGGVMPPPSGPVYPGGVGGGQPGSPHPGPRPPQPPRIPKK